MTVYTLAARGPREEPEYGKAETERHQSRCWNCPVAPRGPHGACNSNLLAEHRSLLVVSLAASSGRGGILFGDTAGTATVDVLDEEAAAVAATARVAVVSKIQIRQRNGETIATRPAGEWLLGQPRSIGNECAVASAAWCTLIGGDGLPGQNSQRECEQQRMQQEQQPLRVPTPHSQQSQCHQQEQMTNRRHQSLRRLSSLCGLTPWTSTVLLLLLLFSPATMNWTLASGQTTSSSSSNSATTSSGSSSTGVRTSTSSGSTVKWTFLIYMLADNNLECFGILDLIEMMEGMAQEPADCVSSGCGVACPSGYAITSTKACAAGKVESRCCSEAAYPDVLVLADRGVSACPVSTGAGTGLDFSLLTSTWTTAKELLVLPGGLLQQVRDLGEIDMASQEQLAGFLQRAFMRFPPNSASSSVNSSSPGTTSTTRKYALVLWDHGNGWKGYGVDDTCSGSASSFSSGCDQFTIASLVSGLSSGLQAVSKLDVIGFDACLMSMYEVAGSLAPYGRTLLASEMLEPGHGWDYGALGAMVKSGASVSTETALAEIWISRYKAQAVSYSTTGVTLALADLSVATARLMPAVGSLADAMFTALTANSSYASGMLRRRIAMAAVGTGDQESSVDLGSMLKELSQASELDSATRAAAVTAAGAYNATLLAFGRDDAMPDGTGLAIYFPAQAARMDSDYLRLTSTSTAALTAVAGRWAAFLTKLYNASITVASSESSFSFLQGSAASVPYIDVASDSYVLQGVLNSPLALSAQSYYGFVDATTESYIMAGTQPALVNGVSVIGTWRRLLWGVTQTLNTTTTSNSTSFPAVSSTTTSTLLAAQQQQQLGSTSSITFSSLMFAAESWTTSADGTTATSVSLSANVRYGDTCNTARSAMTSAVLKYTYRFSTGRATMQLFAQQPSGAYGEVSAQAGGVIVPVMYKLPRDFSGPQSTTYEYSGCLKWGYNGTVRVVAAYMDDAADTLGLDVREAMLMFLMARDISLTKVAYLVGSFSLAALADTSVGGCQCLTAWRYNGTVNNGCANPNNDTSGPWCPILAGSCTHPQRAQGSISDSIQPWDYCLPSRTLAGCSCAGKYATDASGINFEHGKCYSGDTRAATRGSWCTVNTTTCPSPFRAHGSNNTLYDYCETKTVEGCFCINSWTYNNVTYDGTCATGFYPDGPPEGFTNSSRWCRVQPGCNTRNQLNGRRIGLCAPAVPRQAGPVNASCVLPTNVSGVVVQDCVPWINGPLPSNRSDGIAPVCPLNAEATSFGICLARDCTALDLSACPATSPQNTNQLASSSWLSRSCLEQLCAAALISRDNSTCSADGERAATAIAQLNTSTAAANVLRSNYSAGSLEGFCTALRGVDCLTTLMLPACPAIRLDGPNAYTTAYVDDSNVGDLCLKDCVKALCAVANTKCGRARLVESLRLTLLEAMDTTCSSAAAAGNATAATFSRLTASLLCVELTAPAVTCASLTTLTASSGEISLLPVSGTSQYAPLTNCTWRIQPPGLSYIQLTFKSFSTEPQYDTVLVKDGDGVVAVVSGGSEGWLPVTLVTDTGLLELRFTSDSSIQMSGFNASYTATVTRILPIPTCAPRFKLVTFTVRTGDYGNENSWVVGGYQVTPNSGSGASSNGSSSSGGVVRVMLAAGGQLPATAYSLFSTSNASLVSTDSQYRNSRFYTTYACLPTGLSMLYLYDGYGDGWTGGSLAISYMLSLTTSYRLLNATVSGLNSTQTLQILSTMPGTAAEYSAALTRNKGSGRFSTKFTLRVSGEPSGASAISELKQLVLRGAIAATLSVDLTAVSVQSMAAIAGSSTSGHRRSLVDIAEDDVASGQVIKEDDVLYGDDVPEDDVEEDEGIEADEEVSETMLALAFETKVGPLTSMAGGTAAEEEWRRKGDHVSGAGADAQSIEMDTHRFTEDEREFVEGQVEVAEATAASAAAAEVEEVEEEEEEGPMVHEEGVVEALLARARDLGLRLLRSGEQEGGGSYQADNDGSMEDMAVEKGDVSASTATHQGWRQGRHGRTLKGNMLTELLSNQHLSESNIADMVSVQQPYFLWRKDAAAAATATVAVDTAAAGGGGGASTGAAAQKLKTPPSVADGTNESLGDEASGNSTNSNGRTGTDDVGNSSSSNSSSGFEVPYGYTMLSNGLIIGPDAVPVVIRGGSSAATTLSSISSSDRSAENTAAIPRSLVSVAVDSEDAAAAGRHLGLGRKAAALQTLDEVVAAMRRNAAHAEAAAEVDTAAATGSLMPSDIRGHNGGRTPVPALQQLLPELLQRGAKHLATMVTATAGGVAAAGDGDAAAISTPADSRDDAPGILGDFDELMLVARSHGGGETGWRMLAPATAAAAAMAGSSNAPDATEPYETVNGRHQAAPVDLAIARQPETVALAEAAAAAVERAVTAAVLVPATTSPAESQQADAPRLQGLQAAVTGLDSRDSTTSGHIVEGSQEEEWRVMSQRRRRQWQRRRQLQQASASSAVDVVVVVTGYATQAEAETAATKIQSVVSSDLSSILADTGWSFAAPSLVGATQILENGQPLSTSSPSGTNWTKLGIIIGASAGGALMLLLVVIVVVVMVRRSKESNGAPVAPAKTIKVAPAPAPAQAQGPGVVNAGKPGTMTARSPSTRKHKPLAQEEAEAKVKAQMQMQMQMRMEMQQAMLRRQQEQLQLMQQQMVAQSNARSGASLLEAQGPVLPPAAAPLMADGEFRRASLAARGPAVGPWMNQGPGAMAPPMGPMASPVMPMYGAAMPGMDPYMMGAMDPYGMGMPYGPFGDPYDLGGMGYDPYGAYGDPYFGGYPVPPGAWGGPPGPGPGPGAAPIPRMGWQ